MKRRQLVIKRASYVAAVLMLVALVGNKTMAAGDHDLKWTAKAGLIGWDAVNDTVVDRHGNTYITGAVMPDLSFTRQAFVTKINADGTYGWTRRLAGADNNEGYAVAVDWPGNVYVAGTGTWDLPFTSGDPTAFGAQTAFVGKFDPAGQMLDLHAIVLPNNAQYHPRGIAVNVEAQIIIGGFARQGTRDWVQIETLDFGVRRTTGILEGSKNDTMSGLAVPPSGFIYVTGTTNSPDFPLTADAFDRSLGASGNDDAYVTVLSAGGDVMFSSFAGGSLNEKGEGISADNRGNVFVVAGSGSTDFPGRATTTPAGTTTTRVLKLDPSFAIAYSTEIAGHAIPNDIAVDSQGRAYVSGLTFPGYTLTPDAISTTYSMGHMSGYVSRLDASGTLDWSTLLTFPGDTATGDDVRPTLAIGINDALHVGDSAYNQMFFNGHPDMEPPFNDGDEITGANFKRNAFVLKFGGDAPPPPPPGNTAVGSAVSVGIPGASVTFAEVTAPGDTILEAISADMPGFPVPGGFRLSGLPGVDITTTATVVAPIIVCFDGSSLSQEDFANATVLHGIEGVWVPEPTTRDEATRQICATAGSLSPFVVAIRVPVLTIAPMFDQTKAHKAGSTVPVKLQVLDATGVNISSAALMVTARNLVRVSTAATSAVADAGNANPDAGFRFDAGSYIFNVSTKGLSVGTYELQFTVGTDVTIYRVQFAVR